MIFFPRIFHNDTGVAVNAQALLIKQHISMLARRACYSFPAAPEAFAPALHQTLRHPAEKLLVIVIPLTFWGV